MYPIFIHYRIYTIYPINKIQHRLREIARCTKSVSPIKLYLKCLGHYTKCKEIVMR